MLIMRFKILFKAFTLFALFVLLPLPAYAQQGQIRFVLISPCQWAGWPGWNFFSFCLEPQNTSILNVTAPIYDSIDYILRWNSSAQAYELYSKYSSNNPYDDFNINESYFIHFISAKNLSVTGQARGDLNLSLVKLWNAPTYPYEFSTNVTKYLLTIDGFNYMLKWNPQTQSYLLYSIYSSLNPFSQIYPAEGQFIYINATNATLYYNRTYLRG